jgi:hypothetical protein
LSTNDPDAGDTTFTYTLVGGDGTNDADNASFAIGLDGVTLKTADSLPRGDYYIRVQTEDAGHLTYSEALTIHVNGVPTDIGLSALTVDENMPTWTAVGTLSTNDPDAGDTITYTLTAGGDNDSFSIDVDPDTGVVTLLTAAEFNHELKGSYTITVRAADSGGLYTEHEFQIDVNDVNEAPVLAIGGYTLTTIEHDNIASAGNTVAVIVGDGISDVDTGAVEGIAIYGLGFRHGTWEFKVGAGNWTAIDEAQLLAGSLLLTAEDFVRYVPDGESSEMAQFYFVAWDQSDHQTAGTYVNAYGTTAFSMQDQPATIEVT